MDDFAGDAVGFELLGVKRTFAVCEVHDRSYRAGLFDSLVGTSTGDAELGVRRVDDEPVVELYRACGAGVKPVGRCSPRVARPRAEFVDSCFLVDRFPECGDASTVT